MDQFISSVTSDIYPISNDSPTGSGPVRIIDKSTAPINFPEGSQAGAVVREIRYRITFHDYGARKTAELIVKSGRYGEFELGQVYFTEFVYLGL
jgi:hypothetical protein